MDKENVVCIVDSWTMQGLVAPTCCVVGNPHIIFDFTKT